MAASQFHGVTEVVAKYFTVAFKNGFVPKFIYVNDVQVKEHQNLSFGRLP
jgi:hypothetical protein